MGDELLHVGGQAKRQTDTTKLIVPFRNFAKTSKKAIISPHSINLLVFYKPTVNVFPARYELSLIRVNLSL